MNDRWGAVRVRLHPEFAGRLVARGKARNIIWREGQIPQGARRFSATLTDDLLNYAFSLLNSAIDARAAGEDDLAQQAFLTAAESIESVVRDGDPEEPRGGYLACVAAAAYAIARYNARAYNMIDSTAANLSPAEEVFRLLILRDLAGLRRVARERLTEISADDERGTLADRELEEVQAASLTFNYLLAIGALVTYLVRGDLEHLARARTRLDEGERAAMHFGFVESWWLQKLSRLLLDDFERFSYHTVLPPRPDTPQLDRLRREYIQEITGRARAQVDLWPSQIDAARRAFNDADDLVVALPTSGGKTRIAEIAMLPVLAAGERVVYVTPLRALCAHVERVLRETFEAVGFSVSTLYDASTIGEGGFVTDITVVTPERLDFALRRDPAAIENVGLVVLDEGHMIGVDAREIRYEQLVDRLVRLARTRSCRFVCLSALLPDGAEFNRFVSWIRDDEEGEAARSEWRPTRQRFGAMVYREGVGRLELDPGTEMTFIPEFVRADIMHVDGHRRTFPAANQPWEWTLATAWRYLDRKESVLIYCPEKRSVNTGARHIAELTQAGILKRFANPLTPFEEATLDEWMLPTDPVAVCARGGVVVMHASIPKAVQQLLHAVLASHRAHVILASPSVAQGLDLAASVVLFHAVYRNAKVIPVSEFTNVAGRAGRAFVDIDGQIIFVSRAGTASLAKWRELCVAGRDMRLTSGIFQVIAQLFAAYSRTHPHLADEDVRFIAEGGWHQTQGTENYDVGVALQQIDDALLTVLEQDGIDPANAAIALDEVLHGTLLWRTLEAHPEHVRARVSSFLTRRAERLAQYTPAQRRAAYLGGIKLDLTRDLETLVAELGPALLEVEELLAGGGGRDQVIEKLLAFAERAFTFEHFRPFAELPADWTRIAGLWLRGIDVPSIGAGDAALAFIEEALRYRLPLAVEVIRGVEAQRPRFSAAAAFSYGSADTVALTLLTDGLTSRTTAHAVAKLLADSVPPDTTALRVAVATDRELIMEMLEPPQAELFRRYVDRGRVARRVEALDSVDRVPLADAAHERDGDAWLFPDGIVATADLLPFALAKLPPNLPVPAGGTFGRVVDGEFLLGGLTPLR